MLEWNLPGIEFDNLEDKRLDLTYIFKQKYLLTNLDTIQNFIDKPNSGVLVSHLSSLKPLAPRSQAGVEWNHQHQDNKPGKDGWPHGEVEEDEGEDDLKRSRPDHV